MTVRRFAPLVLVIALVAGCGGGSDTASPDGSSTSAEPAPCRKVKHAIGTSCIPQDPQRVVTLGYNTPLEYALSVGLPVVGYDGDAAAPNGIPSYLDPALVEGATFVGDGETPDLEKVAALEPDLIIYAYDNGNYPQVSSIAPTIVLKMGYASYRDDFMSAAEMLDREDEAEAFLAELDTRIDEVATEIAPTIDGKTVSVFRTGSDGKAEISGEGDYIAELFEELGAERPDTQKDGYQQIGLEQIGLLDADVAYPAYGYANSDPDSVKANEETREQFESNPLWGTLKFVQDDQIYPIDPMVFGLTGTYWAYGMLDEIETSSAS